MRLECYVYACLMRRFPELAGRVRVASKKSIWAKHIDDVKQSNQLLEKLFEDFNEKVGKVLPKLYQP
jgi:hypothetical protein